MNKAIILISGSPASKNKFLQIAKKNSWVWNVNFNGFLADALRGILADQEKDEKFYKFVSDLKQLAIRNFDAERKYLLEKIKNFREDGDTKKTDGNNFYENFILIIHGVSKDSELLEELKNEGAYRISLSKREYNTIPSEMIDMTYYEDEETFEDDIEKFLKIIMKEN